MRVLLYSKTDCGLCDAFHFELMDLQTVLGFAYEKRHLGEGDALFAQFEGAFPVVEIRADGSDDPIRLNPPTSQRQLRARIREVATREQQRALPAQGS